MDKQDVDQDLQLNDRDEALMEDVARLGIDQNDDHDREDKAVDNAEEDSTYPEVESAVANVDDYYMPCGTFRSWVIGLLWAVLIPGLNQYVEITALSLVTSTSTTYSSFQIFLL